MGTTTDTADRGDAVERRFPPQPESVAQARRLVRDLLTTARRDDLVETAELLVSEVVTNALLHAGTPIQVNARIDDEALRVEVSDGSVHLPVRRRYAATAGTGRGMMMLEHLVDDWGVAQGVGGKTVWFVLATAGSWETGEPRPGRLEGSPVPESAGDVVAVELRHMPLLLHSAWQEHAGALCRELLLALLEGPPEPDLDPIRMHAEATDALAILAEHVPEVDIDLAEPDRLMQGATEPRVSAELVRVPVPRDSVAHFTTLDRAIRAAIDLSRGGRALTPPTQPEIQAFRSWLVRQVVDQAAGVAPVPWSASEVPPPQPTVDLGVDLGPVAAAPDGRIAADPASRILAVSRTALEILGYDDPGEVVGQRLLQIIPERFRQAHVAGFTMYQLAGRKPLLGRPVVVPARRRDGTEVPVRLLVTAEPTPSGGELFLAEIARVEVPGR